MPRNYGSSSTDEERQNLRKQSEQRAKRMFTGFIDFAFSGNILEIAIGLMLVPPLPRELRSQT
jgi:large conductance mechanosensitive channel